MCTATNAALVSLWRCLVSEWRTREADLSHCGGEAWVIRRYGNGWLWGAARNGRVLQGEAASEAQAKADAVAALFGLATPVAVPRE